MNTPDTSEATTATGTARRRDRYRPVTPVAVATERCVSRLQNMYLRDHPSAVAALAQLRRGLGGAAYDRPGTWGLGLLEELTQLREEALATAGNGPEGLPAWVTHHTSRGGAEVVEAEDEAAHLAVSLWSLHQQSVHDARMHTPGWSLGYAVRRLARQSRGGPVEAPDTAPDAASTLDVDETLRKRFVRIGTSSSFDMLGVRLREVVTLLRGARIPLDYSRLADQLRSWQNEELRADVRRTWGRDFHMAMGPLPNGRTPPDGGASARGPGDTAGVDDSAD
ncbi:type I-E CRISPR-associated protein Cse2/CasB [Streptomyces sp. JNUCC 64]